jgi:hypothetical protein
MISSLSPGQFFLACALVAVMGVAIQHGGTCMVAAVDEWLKDGTTTRLRGLLEASLWVLAGLLLANISWAATPVLGYETNPWTWLGGSLLGLGALINGACVIGTIGKLSSGQWSFFATPPGYALGSWLIYVWDPQSLNDARIPDVAWPPLYEWLQGIPAIALIVLGASLILARLFFEWMRTGRPMHAVAWIQIAAKPHNATVWIGLSFLGLYLLAPDWSYPNLLDDLAKGRSDGLWQRSLLLWVLFAGAFFAGWRKGIWSTRAPNVLRLLECGAGGLLMGLGSALIPGGNDGLIFIGMPLLWPFAWSAMTSMALTIAVLLKFRQLVQR